jgi:hypothetical protein
MHRENSHEQDDDHRYRRERDKRTEQNEQSPDKLDDDRRPTQQKRHGDADSMQDIDEILRAAGELRVTVLHKSEPDNKPKWNGIPSRRNR